PFAIYTDARNFVGLWDRRTRTKRWILGSDDSRPAQLQRDREAVTFFSCVQFVGADCIALSGVFDRPIRLLTPSTGAWNSAWEEATMWGQCFGAIPIDAPSRKFLVAIFRNRRPEPHIWICDQENARVIDQFGWEYGQPATDLCFCRFGQV